MKYFLIAGEASGDLHGAKLMEGLKMTDKNADFRYFGGDLMQIQGGTLIKHYREMAFLGYIDVLKNIKTIGRNFNICKNQIKTWRPDVVILIDYPSFNLKIAKYAKSLNIKVFYYISPKIWAWKEYRIKKIKKYVDKMFVILPFEIDFYKKHNYPVIFEGNPLIDSVEEKIKNKPSLKEFQLKNSLSKKPIIAVLPGSREYEIKRIMPIMMEAVKKFNQYQIVIAGTSALPENLYLNNIRNNNEVKLIFNQTYELLMYSEAAVVASGTATLETALLNIPQVVCYVISKSTFFIAKHLVKINYISLVNLIMDKPVIKELIQNQFTPENLSEELKIILFNQEKRNLMLSDYAEIRKKLGEPGSYIRFAKKMYEFLT